MATLLVWLALVIPTPGAKAPAAARTMGKLLDCTSHSAWTEPKGWSVFRSAAELVVVSESSVVRVVAHGEIVAEIIPELWLLSRHGVAMHEPMSNGR